MNLQVIKGENGKPTGVFIPLKTWEAIKNQYHIEDIKVKKNEKKELKKELKKQAFKDDLTQAFKELRLILDGKLEGRPAREVLNEL